MSIFIAIVGLALLILIHEAGHFFVARAVGMNPRKFYVGFPPALVKRQRNGIEYGIGAIPFGGYVKIPGMHRPAPGDLDMYFGRAVAEQPSLTSAVEALRRRLAASEYQDARATLAELSDEIEQAELSGAARSSAARGLGEIGDSLGPDAYWRARTWKRVAVIFAGPAANLVLAIVIFAAVLMTVGGERTRTVDSVAPDTPAAAAGLQAGDKIVAIGGQTVDADEVSKAISTSGGHPLTLLVERDGTAMALGPVQAEKMDGVYRLGFVLRGRGLGPAESVWESVRYTGIVTREIGGSLGRLVTGDGRDEISSPIGIVQVSSQQADRGTSNYLWVLGLISLSLALLNLLPLLPLDGGHIMFSLIEGIRGKAVTREVYERVSALGLAVVLLLFFIGLSNDVGRLGN